MITTEIKFSGVEYPCRMVKDNQGEYLIIGSTDLLDALQPGNFEDENEGFANEEAAKIYDEIFFFTDERTLALPDEELIEELRRDNPEWF
ncbi:hypothetical protein [Phocaeicola salanitronis]|uniref:hypothetical protein n=1 Tax=Phocaeicola salanitronis TaxID=376805 RepID=UPI003207BFA8